MTRVRSWVLRLLLTRELEGVLALWALMFGVWLLLPSTVFTLALDARSTSALKAFWGLLFSAAGLAYIAILALRHFGKLLTDVPARRAAAALTWLWGNVFTAVLLAAPHTTLVALYAMQMVAAGWVYLRLRLGWEV